MGFGIGTGTLGRGGAPSLLAMPPVNTGRQLNLDVARGLAVIFMVLVHVQESLGSEAAQETLMGRGVEFLGNIPSAPVFLFLLGAGMAYSRQASLQDQLKRGLALIAAGYALNLVRGSLPEIWRWLATSEPAFLHQALEQFLYVDIFQAAGLSIVLISGLRHAFSRTLAALAFTIALLFALNRIFPSFTSTQILTDLFWGISPTSFFPAFPWVIYPMTGWIFGQHLIRTPRIHSFYAWIGVTNALLLVALHSLYLNRFDTDHLMGLDDHAYYHHSLYSVSIFIPFILTWLSGLHFLLRVIPHVATRILSHLSRHVTEIFIIHWVFITWMMLFLDDQQYDIPHLFLFAAITLLVSTGLASYHTLRSQAIVLATRPSETSTMAP